MAEELYVVPDCRCGLHGDAGEQEARAALLGAIRQLAARVTTANALQSLVHAYAVVVGAAAGSFPVVAPAPQPNLATAQPGIPKFG